MPATLTITAYVRAKDEQKARSLIEQMSSACGVALRVAKAERYWKDEALFHVLVEGELSTAASIADGVLDALTRMASVASHWRVGAPNTYADGRWELVGLCTDEREMCVPGVTFAEFTVWGSDTSRTALRR